MNKCPNCYSLNVRDRAVVEDDLPADTHYACNSCGHRWEAE